MKSAVFTSDNCPGLFRSELCIEHVASVGTGQSADGLWTNKVIIVVFALPIRSVHFIFFCLSIKMLEKLIPK
jgi:hypothetical protein